MADNSFSSSQGYSSSQNRPQSQRTRGRFADGNWYCDCEPRLRAIHREARNGQAENVGRHFWRCKKPRASDCGFFLWDEEAARRTAAVVQSGRDSEPDPSATTGLEQAGQDATTAEPQSLPTRSPPPPYTSRTPQPTTPTNTAESARAAKRKVPWKARDDSAEPPSTPRPQMGRPRQRSTDSEWDISAGEEREMQRIAQSTPSTPTPYKAAKTSRMDTPNRSPSRRLSTGQGRATEVRHGLATPERTARKPAAEEDEDLYAMPTGSQASASSASSSSRSRQHPSLVGETLVVLQRHEVQLTPSIIDELQEVSNRHEMRMRGSSSGREIAQMAVARYKTQVSELKERVSLLESRLESSKGLIKKLREHQ